MSVGDLYSVRAQYEYLGEQMENTFFYLQTLGTGSALDIAEAFFDDIVTSMVFIQHDSVNHIQVVAINLDDTSDFTTRVASLPGQRTGSPMTPFASWGFITFSTDRAIRSGGKRIGGLSETDVDSGVAVAGILTPLSAFATVLQAPLEDVGFTNRWIFSLHTEGNKATDFNPLTVATRAVAYFRVTTQSSRKFSV